MPCPQPEPTNNPWPACVYPMPVSCPRCVFFTWVGQEPIDGHHPACPERPGYVPPAFGPEDIPRERPA